MAEIVDKTFRKIKRGVGISLIIGASYAGFSAANYAVNTEFVKDHLAVNRKHDVNYADRAVDNLPYLNRKNTSNYVIQFFTGALCGAMARGFCDRKGL